MSNELQNATSGGLAGVIRYAITQYMKDVHTCLPGKIISFDKTTQTAKVQPLIKRILSGKGEIDLPQLINVIVWQPKTENFSITFPINKDDECLVLFSERALDGWFRDGGSQKPKDWRMHSLSDAICLVGMSSKPNVIQDYDDTNLVIRNKDNTQKIEIKEDKDITITTENTVLEIKPDGNINITAPNKVTIDTPLAEFSTNVIINGDLDVQGATTLSNTVTSNGKDISDTHTHNGVTPGGGVTGPVV